MNTDSDDVLRYIESTIPMDNEKAISAAIKFVQYDNQIYFHVSSQKEAVEWVKRNARIKLFCECFSGRMG